MVSVCVHIIRVDSIVNNVKIFTMIYPGDLLDRTSQMHAKVSKVFEQLIRYAKLWNVE